jgi:peptidoglycan hydrolase-like protein with peptidoglycan-binding domain
LTRGEPGIYQPVWADIPGWTVLFGESSTGIPLFQAAHNKLEGLSYIAAQQVDRTGVYDDQTMEQVKVFQADFGLSRDGMAGPNTLQYYDNLLVALGTGLIGQTTTKATLRFVAAFGRLPPP